MDAKPQRPTRTIRVVRDENQVPVNIGAKSLHQRNKSTPALSTLAGQAGVKNALSKRAAFGDVSNTVNAVRLTKDDSSIAAKQGGVLLEKPAVLSRPAQRPVSMAAAKSLPKDTVTTNPNLANPKHVTTHKLSVKSQPTFTKRTQVVFKDTALPSVPEAAKPLSKPQPQPSQPNTAPTDTKAQQPSAEPPVGHSLDTKPLPNPSREVQPKENIKPPPEAPAAVNSDEMPIPLSHRVYLEANGQLRPYSLPLDKDGSQAMVKSSVNAAPARVNEPKVLSNPAVGVITRSHPPFLTAIDNSRTEPEEYWDDEDDENYDEDGYVTARSYRSRGDNTTGGATVVLFPKVTQQVKHELALAKQTVEKSRTLEDIEDDFWDTSMVAEYGEEIFQYMREQEIRLLPNAHYMDNQAEIQWSMRSVLMDWLVQVHHRFSLLPETLFLCVNYIDRFLSCKIVSLGKLQLVGATAIFIAAKYEEINCPSLQEIVYMVDNAYSSDEVLKAERFMLNMLQFELGWPGPMSFLRRISKADDYDLETRTLAKYFLEITIMDERFVGCPPSFTAAGAHCLARMMLRKGEWSQPHIYYSNYTYSQLYPLVALILECCESPLKHHAAVFEKYSDKRFKRASYFVKTEMAKGFKLPDIYRESSAMYMLSLYDNNNPALWGR
ncbi:hypothetical protein AJ80_08954 [Polytolypa hystricis UAMH7299]|uniref:Uncharacterized protein n=1 Tax=Polytolypa hystricis (strain UAMH7299) TaxID=1447883 RepID=A0A2B7WZE4_POLH7|nr:hypothetical protein AJ80_08954 [Polytolypa hystricis UAMH7299]